MQSQDPERPVDLDHAKTVRTLAELINSALPLARHVASDEFTADEREQLRLFTPIQHGRSNAVFELSNLLGRLCSESAWRLCSPDPAVQAVENSRLQELSKRA